METKAARFQHQKHARGEGQWALRLPSFLFSFLHSEDKCHYLLFWRSYQEHGAGAAGSNSKSFVRRSPNQICKVHLQHISTFIFLTNMTQTLTKNLLLGLKRCTHYLFMDTRGYHRSLEIPKNPVSLWHSALIFREEQTKAAWANRDNATWNNWAKPYMGQLIRSGRHPYYIVHLYFRSQRKRLLNAMRPL